MGEACALKERVQKRERKGGWGVGETMTDVYSVLAWSTGGNAQSERWRASGVRVRAGVGGEGWRVQQHHPPTHPRSHSFSSSPSSSSSLSSLRAGATDVPQHPNFAGAKIGEREREREREERERERETRAQQEGQRCGSEGKRRNGGRTLDLELLKLIVLFQDENFFCRLGYCCCCHDVLIFLKDIFFPAGSI